MNKRIVLVVAVASLVLLAGCGGKSFSLGGINKTFGSGGIHVSSSPPGAKVYINEQYIGRSPLNRGVDQGQYFVVLKKAGYEDYEEWVTVEAGRSGKLDAKLTRKE